MQKFSLNSPWQLKQVDAARADVQAALDRAGTESLEARLARALLGVTAGDGAYSPDAQLSRLLYVIAALSHHARWGGLSDRDATELQNLAEALLKTHGVERSTSTLSVLWGELLVAKSQILRLKGRTFESMWEQHLSHQASRRNPVGTPAFHSLAAGLRALRLGMLSVATESLRRAETGDLPARNREQARLARVQATRLSGRLDEAKTLLDDLKRRPDLSGVAERDVIWEDFVQRAVQDQDLEPMMKAISARGTHRHATFLLEAFLWARAVTSRQFEDRTHGIRTIRKACGDLLSRATAFRVCFDAASQLDDAYDPDVPLQMRARAIGESLSETRLLPSLDKELLVRASAFRWLLRSRQLECAAFVFADYESRCYQLTGGVSGASNLNDVLKVMGDVDRPTLLEHYIAPPLRSAS